MSAHGSSLSPLPRLARAPRDLVLRILFLVLVAWPFVVAAILVKNLFGILL